MSIVVLLIIMLAHLHHTVHLPHNNFCEHWQNDFTKLFK